MSDADRPAVSPQLYYENPNEAVEWLCRVLSFTEDFRDVGGTPWPNLFYSITVMVPDVDEHFALACGEGARIVAEPTDQPWGFRDYEVVDLEGRQWNFS